MRKALRFLRRIYFLERDYIATTKEERGDFLSRLETTLTDKNLMKRHGVFFEGETDYSNSFKFYLYYISYGWLSSFDYNWGKKTNRFSSITKVEGKINYSSNPLEIAFKLKSVGMLNNFRRLFFIIGLITLFASVYTANLKIIYIAGVTFATGFIFQLFLHYRINYNIHLLENYFLNVKFNRKT